MKKKLSFLNLRDPRDVKTLYYRSLFGIICLLLSLGMQDINNYLMPQSDPTGIFIQKILFYVIFCLILLLAAAMVYCQLFRIFYNRSFDKDDDETSSTP